MRPSSRRFTFTSWRLWKKGSPLVESGLIGPVTLRPAIVARLAARVMSGERLADIVLTPPESEVLVSFVRTSRPRILTTYSSPA